MPEGGVADSFNKLSHLGSSHFRNLYKQPPGSTVADIINIAGHFPKFVNENEAEALFDPVTPRELESTLKWFKKEKSPGTNGWTIEFYITFYELLSNDLLRVVEECRISRSLYNAINSTFIALIPKSDSPSSSDDYRPISLCNVLYKIISKIIANCLRPILSRNNLSSLSTVRYMKPSVRLKKPSTPFGPGTIKPLSLKLTWQRHLTVSAGSTSRCSSSTWVSPSISLPGSWLVSPPPPLVF